MSVNKSLEELEKKEYGNPDLSSSYLVRHCIQLAKKPINTFSIEDLRIMIGQNIGLIYLVPLAIEKLQENILAEGDLYPGDLLKSVVNIEGKFWHGNKQSFFNLKMIVYQNEDEISEAGISVDILKSIFL